MSDFKLLASYFQFEERGLNDVITEVRRVKAEIQTLTGRPNRIAFTLSGTTQGVQQIDNSLRSVKTEADEVTRAMRRIETTVPGLRKTRNAFDGIEIEARDSKLEVRSLRNEIRRTGNAATSLLQKTARISGSVGQITGGIGGGARFGGLAAIAGLGPGAIAAATAIGGLAVTYQGFKAGLLSNAEVEQQRIAFKTIIGDAGQAITVFRDLEEFANSTPFQTDEVIQGARQLLAFGTEAGNVVDELKRIGDVSSGVNANLTEIAEIYGKARVQGRLFAEDINQLTGRGIPVITELSKQFGVTTGEIRKMVEEGQIGFNELRRAFISMTSEGGRFFNITEEQSNTASGLWSTLTSQVKAFIRDAFEPFAEAMKGTLRVTISLVKYLRDALENGKRLLVRVFPRLAKFFPSLAEGTKTKKTEIDVDSGAVTKALEELKALQREVKQLGREGESLRQSLRTPYEEAREDLGRYSLLLSRGAINQDTFTRAVEASKQKLNEATKAARQLQAAVGAGSVLLRGTQAEFNFRIEDDRKTEERLRLARADQQTQAQHNQFLEGILRELEAQRAILLLRRPIPVASIN